MRLRIDMAGRVVLPKPVRERLGLHEGSTLDLTETADGLVIKSEAHVPSLVHMGELPRGYDILRAIEEDREDRDRKILGL